MNNVITNLREGDHNCFKEIYDSYHFKIYRFTSRYTLQDSDTEDIVQNVFIHLWEYREKINPGVTLDAVLFKASRQEISKWYKKQGAFPSLIEGAFKEGFDAEYEPDQATDLKLTEIYTLLERIPEKRRKIFKLHKFEELSYKEIAQEMAMTPTAVAKQISKTLQYLREHASHDMLLIWFATVIFFS